MQLTDLSVRHLKTEAKQRSYFDDTVQGFGVRVSPGGTKTFVLVYGPARERITIGRYGVISLADARAEAKRILAERTLGARRPKHVRFDVAMTEFCEGHCDRKNRPGTAYETKRASIPLIDWNGGANEFWHQLMISDLVGSVEIACKWRGLPFKTRWDILGQMPFHLSSSYGNLRPDELFSIDGTHFVLEADRGTETNIKRWGEKIDKYSDVLKARAYQTQWGVQPRPELEVQNGDLLVTRKNTYDLVAASAYVRNPPPRLLLPDTIFRFRLKQRSHLSPVYLWGLLSFPSFRKHVQRLASGSAGSMPGISKEKFMAIRCPAAPLALQQRFSDLAERHQQLRAIQVEALRQAEHLFQTLLQQAFTA
jgi:hypothetical protein